MITDNFVDVADMSRQDLEDKVSSLKEEMDKKESEMMCLRSNMSYYGKIIDSLDQIQKRKLSVTFNGGLWSVYDEKGEISSSNSLIDAIKKV